MINDNNQKKLMNMLPHLLGLFTSWIGPLIIFLILRNKGKSNVLENAKHALNFQLCMIIYLFISWNLTLFIIGIIMLYLFIYFALIIAIIASVKSYRGEIYTYPLEIKFLK